MLKIRVTVAGDQICFFFFVKIEKNKIRINQNQSAHTKSPPQTCFFLSFNKSMDHRPINQPTTDPMTH